MSGESGLQQLPCKKCLMTQTRYSNTGASFLQKTQKEPISKQGKRQPNVKNVKKWSEKKTILLGCARLLPQMVLVNPPNPATDSREEQTGLGKGHILILPRLLRRGAEGAAGNKQGRGLLDHQHGFSDGYGGPTLNQRKAPKPKVTSVGHEMHFLVRGRETC